MRAFASFPPLAAPSLQWRRDWPLVALVAAAATIAAGLLNARSADRADVALRVANSGATQSPPSPPLMLFRPVAPADALALNRAIPMSQEPNPAALPFHFHGQAEDYQRALGCLSLAIAYEAGNEPVDGQRAVAQVILNRVRHPAFPKSICGVVYQGSTLPTGCQFTFTCDGSLMRARRLPGMRTAKMVAKAALDGSVFAPVGYATHYHADYVVPYWSTSLAKNAVIGAHIFYRWPGYWGSPGSFAGSRLASEPNPLLLRAIAVAAAQSRGSAPQQALTAPDVSARVDPGVELLGIVALLAGEPTPADSDGEYVTAVRAHFTPFTDHLAVQMYRQLTAADGNFRAAALAQMLQAANGATLQIPAFSVPCRPAIVGAGFTDALRDFASVSGFDAFFKDQQPYYASLAHRYDGVAAEVSGGFQRYTGMQPRNLALLLAPLLASASESADQSAARRGAILLPATAPATLQSAAFRSELSRRYAQLSLDPAADARGADADSCGSGRPQPSDTAQSEILRAVSLRIAGSGAPSQRNRFTSTIDEALTAYEQNRKWFATFGAFYPTLLKVASCAPGAAARGAARRSKGDDVLACA